MLPTINSLSSNVWSFKNTGESGEMMMNYHEFNQIEAPTADVLPDVVSLPCKLTHPLIP
jgi:hypothetical protein